MEREILKPYQDGKLWLSVAAWDEPEKNDQSVKCFAKFAYLNQKGLRSLESPEVPLDVLVDLTLFVAQQGYFTPELMQKLKHGLTQEPGIDKKPEQETYAFGSITGTLGVINVHDDKRYVIYPTVGATEVDCYFDTKLMKTMASAVGEYVTMTGKLRYQVMSTHPYQVEVHEIEIHPDKEELPTLSSFAGIAPEATGDVSTEEFIQNLRNEWQ